MATSSTRSVKNRTEKNKDLLGPLSLARTSSAAIRKAVKKNDAKAFQAAWLDALSRPLKRIRKALGKSPLLAMWSVNTMDLSSRERELAVSLENLASQRQSEKKKSKGSRKSRKAPAISTLEEILSSWMADVGDSLGAWECLAVAEILLREAAELSPECFTQVLVLLSRGVQEEQAIGGLFQGEESSTKESSPINLLITVAEVPWICSLVLGPVIDIAVSRQEAAAEFEKSLLEACDADGVVHGSILNQLPEWLAPLTRGAFWSMLCEVELWSDESQIRLAALAERSAMLLIPEQPSDAASESQACQSLALREVLDVLLPSSGTEWDQPLLKLVQKCAEPAGEVRRPGKQKKQKNAQGSGTADKKAKKSDASAKQELVTSWQSDSSCVAILRTGLEHDADLATLEWHSSTPHFTLTAAGVTLFSGAWNWEVQVDGQPIENPSTWKCSCWFLDPETVFVELEGEVTGSVNRVRQALVAPQDRFAMMTDSVTCGDASKKIRMTTSIPLASGTTSESDAVTREMTLAVGLRSVRAFPLWMEDDRVLSTLGSCRVVNGSLEMSAVGEGGVTLPLALDWHPGRKSSPADWSRLTVTELRRVAGSHEASAHRVRIGDHQILVYRSLQAGENSRAVLGLHTWDETVYSRVPGLAKAFRPLVEVETPEREAEEKVV